MTVTKEVLVNSIEDHLDLSKIKSNEVFESLMEIIKRTLENGEDVLISGFGKFCVKDKKQRRGRNPATGQDKMMRARRVLVFKYSGILKDMINGKE